MNIQEATEYLDSVSRRKITLDWYDSDDTFSIALSVFACHYLGEFDVHNAVDRRVSNYMRAVLR